MFRLLKNPNSEYKLIDQAGNLVAHGDKETIINMTNYMGFQDVEMAIGHMEENFHNVAEFGINRRYLFTKVSPLVPNVRLVQ